MIRWREAALLLLFLSPAHTQPGRAYSTVVQIAGWTTTGERLDKIWAVLTPVGGNEKYAGSGKLVELSVPTGEYILQVDAPGFEARRQILKAYQPNVFRSVALPVAYIHGQMASGLTGTVRNYDGQIRDLRVRLMGLYGNELRESVVDAQGSFSFPADEGAYILLIVADVKKGIVLVDSRPLRILGKEIITVDLAGKHGTLIPRPNQ